MGTREDDACNEWTGATRNGYGCLRFEGRTRYAHRVAFYLDRGYWPEICRHKCDNRLCHNPQHLEDGTKADNSRDMVMRDRSTRGERHPDVILTEQDVREIRLAYDSKSTSVKDLAYMYGVSRQNITSIGKRRSWKHV